MATLLFRKAKPEITGEPRTGIIDIGSNSIRLVVYQGPDEGFVDDEFATYTARA